MNEYGPAALSGEIEAVKVCMRQLIARAFAGEDEAAIRQFFSEARQLIAGMDAHQLPPEAVPQAPFFQDLFDTANSELVHHERIVLQIAGLSPP